MTAAKGSKGLTIRVYPADNGVVAGGERIFRMILDSASGRRTESERLGLGDPEFAPWPIGAVM